ncbi:unnamed protein product [Caenorhabditis sp. 36 PRJEB53466]|nr:unnamed protein product [Caenorhabditis sp. 36 PRJEB53466]
MSGCSVQSSSLGPVEDDDHLTMDDTSWWKKQEKSPPPSIPPISPLSFAFMPPEQREAFNFSMSPESTNRSEGDDEKMAKLLLKDDSEDYSPVSSPNSSSSSKKNMNVRDFMIVDGEPSQGGETYEPKAHLGWASFGESIQPPARKTPEQQTIKRKVFVVRSQHNESSQQNKTYQIINPTSVRKRPSSSVSGPTPKTSVKSESKDSDSEDEIVDVVGIDDDDETVVKVLESGKPPDLPPQRPLGSRFELQRQKKEYYNRRGFDSDDDMRDESTRSSSPPPRLEPQMNGLNNVLNTIHMIEKDPLPVEINDEDLERRLGLAEHDPTQMLKTKVSQSAIPILPLSKSIMERKKAAIQMTKHAIKRIPAPKSTAKNMTVAPRSVQIPAYTEKAPITLYSKFYKSSNISTLREPRVGCFRCREKPPVDMSSFKFLEDSSVVAVRAHLCDQTRVMIARTAVFNREYARRLGDQAHGTIWQKPDEVTAQMTGFCSATVRRCIDVANLSIIPKCADRIGVSKNELASLKLAFGAEKFCGQSMRTPHVLSQYYAVKSQNPAYLKLSDPQPHSSGDLLQAAEEKDAEEMKKEEARKHHPLIQQQIGASSSLSSVPAMPLKKTVLRWSSIQGPRILRQSTPKTAITTPKLTVVPVMKTSNGGIAEEQKPETSNDSNRRRGRPRKEKPFAEEKKTRIVSTRRLRSSKRLEIEEAVREVTDFLLEKVAGKA